MGKQLSAMDENDYKTSVKMDSTNGLSEERKLKRKCNGS
jgi:hypothetical protein